jgi:hypothetical protein
MKDLEWVEPAQQEMMVPQHKLEENVPDYNSDFCLLSNDDKEKELKEQQSTGSRRGDPRHGAGRDEGAHARQEVQDP